MEQIVRMYTADIQRWLRRRVKPADLEDCRQQVLLEIHRSLPTFRGGADIRTWIFSITWHKTADYVKRRKAFLDRHAHRSPDQELSSLGDQEDVLAWNERAELLYDALDTLVPAQREVVVLNLIEGFTITEIAEMLASPRNTVYWRRREALAKIRAFRELAKDRPEVV